MQKAAGDALFSLNTVSEVTDVALRYQSDLIRILQDK